MTHSPPTVAIGSGEYALERVPPGLDAWAVEARNCATGRRYRVAVDARGVWRCSCPAFRFDRPGFAVAKSCKHTREVARVKALAEELTR